MSADALRRYLQPSPTLRWHPWAPVLAAVLLIAFVFILGAQWGYESARRGWSRINSNADAFVIRIEQEAKHPARDMVRRAGRIDAFVQKWVRDSENPPGTWDRIRSQFERWVFRGYVAAPPYPKSYVADLAEFRLRELSGSAPAWQVTSRYCHEMSAPLTGLDLREVRAAEAYSKVLGRTISPEQLAPAVPNARCEPSRRVQ